MNSIVASTLRKKIQKRLAPFADPGFWILTLLSMLPLYMIDRPMALTLMQWCAFFLALAGASIVVTRILLPQVDLTDWLLQAARPKEALPAAVVVLAVCILLSAVLIGMVLWARA